MWFKRQGTWIDHQCHTPFFTFWAAVGDRWQCGKCGRVWKITSNGGWMKLNVSMESMDGDSGAK